MDCERQQSTPTPAGAGNAASARPDAAEAANQPRRLLALLLETLGPDATLADLPLHQAAIDPATTCGEALRLFRTQPSLPGLILVDGGEPRGMISRRALFEAVAPGGEGPRPDASEEVPPSAADAPLVLASDHPVADAAERALARPGDAYADPVVVRFPDGSVSLLDGRVLCSVQARLARFEDPAANDRRQRLRNAASALDSILQSATRFAIVITDPDLRIGQLNPTAEAMLGVSAAEGVGRRLLDVRTDRGLGPQALEGAVAEVAAQGFSNRETRGVDEDGEVWGLRHVLMPMRDDSGAWTGYILISEDDTARLAATEELERSRSFLLTLLDAMPTGMIVIDLHRRIRRINRAAMRMLGIETPEELVGQSCEQCLCESDGRCPVLDDQDTSEREKTLRTRDGRRITVLASAIPVTIDHEEMLLETFIDISERKRMEQALRASEQQLRLFIEHTPAAVAMFDRDMRYIVATRKWHEDHRLGDEELTGRSHYEVFPDVPELWRKTYERCLRGRSKRCEEERILHANGSFDWIRWEVHPWTTDDGEIGGIIKFTEAITDRKWAEEALWDAKMEAEKANRLKSEFMANVSHEIRTPLNAILGFAETILNGKSIRQAHEQCRSILRESDHLLSLINTLLDHAKIEAGKLDLEHRILDMSQLLESLVSSAQVQARRKGVRFEARMEPGVPQYILGDALRIRQVLLNLISNAIKFTEDGSVTVVVERAGAEMNLATLKFSVIDTGIGIPRDKQADIFNSFTQADGSTTRRYGGTGLGTTISRQLVSLMGGQMGLESEQGKGSTFWFTLPLEACEKPAEQDDLVRIPTGQSAAPEPRIDLTGRILIAEDYPPSQEVARLHLESVGHVVDLAANGAEALERCRGHAYDLILMDVQMPVMDGYEACRRIRELGGANGRAPILALTANAESDTRAACLQSGMNDVLTKPIRREPMLAAVGKWMAREESGGESARPDPVPDASAEGTDAAEATPAAGESTERASNDEPIRREEAVREFAGNSDLFDGVLRQFLQQAAGQIPRLREALADGDADALRSEAHKIKGGAANLTADALSQAAGAVEHLAEEGRIDELAACLDRLEAQVRRLEDFATP